MIRGKGLATASSLADWGRHIDGFLPILGAGVLQSHRLVAC